MPWETLDWARKARAGSPGRKAVLMVLAEYADENDSCYPSQALIADATEQSERTVRTQLAELEQRGLIRREHRGGNGTGRTSDRYFLLRQPAKSAGGATGNATGKPTPRATGRLLPPNNHEQLDVELPKRHTRESQSVDQLLVHSFGVFWSLYPRKEAKGAARKVWPAAVKAAGGPTPIIEGCKRFALDPNRDPRYTPHPATWLNQERWGDDPLPSRTGLNVNGGRPSNAVHNDEEADRALRSIPSGAVDRGLL